MPQLKLTQTEFNALPLGKEVNITAVSANREWTVGCTRGTKTTFLNWGNDWTVDGELIRNSDLTFLEEPQTEFCCGCGGYDTCGCGGGIVEVQVASGDYYRDEFGNPKY
jgi:hypothetical protein